MHNFLILPTILKLSRLPNLILHTHMATVANPRTYYSISIDIGRTDTDAVIV